MEQRGWQTTEIRHQVVVLQAESGVDGRDSVHDLGGATAQRWALDQAVIVGRATLAAATSRRDAHVTFEVGAKAPASFLAALRDVHIARIRDGNLVRLTGVGHAEPVALEDRQIVLWQTKQARQAEWQAELRREI